MQILIILLATHSVGDFLLQPDALIQRKRKFGYLLLHTAIHGTLAWAAMRIWGFWQLPLYILLAHLVIDFIKLRCPDTAVSFAVDQVAHLVSLAGFVWLAGRNQWIVEARPPSISPYIVLLGGFVAAVFGAGYFVGKVMGRITEDNAELELKGLENGGKWIGQLERALIFVFVMLGQLAAVGFLVTAKSILRFPEAKQDQKHTEYILIGTLLSFFLALVVASGTKWALGWMAGGN